MANDPDWRKLESRAGTFAVLFMATGAALLVFHSWIGSAVALSLASISAADAFYAARRQASNSGFYKDSSAPHFVRRRRVRISNRDAHLVLAMLSNPRKYVIHTRQFVEPHTRAIEIITRYSVQTRLKPGKPTTAQIPLVMCRKGELKDDLKISVDGREVPIRTYEEFCNVVMASIESLVRRVDAANLSVFRNYEGRIWGAITHPACREDRERWARDADVDQLIANLNGSSLRAEVVDLVSNVLRILSDSYFLLVDVPCTERVIVSVSERLIGHRDRQRLETTRSRSEKNSILVAVRNFYGVRTATLAVDVAKALRSEEFHLEMMGPQGTYLAHVVSSHPRSDFKGYIRVRSRSGQRYLHIYSKGLAFRDGARESDPLFGGVYFERPPGSLLPSVSATAAAAFLIWAVAHRASPNSSANFAALLLAAPGAVVGWTGFGPTQLVGTTVCSRVYATFTLLLCLLAIGLYMFQTAKPEGWLVNLYTYSWKFLIAASACLACASIYSLIKRVMRHSLTLRSGGLQA